jgi:hypothetical protein
MKTRTLLLVAVLLLVFGTILIWLITPKTATSPTQVTAVAPSLPPQLVQQAEPDVAATDPVTNNSPLPSLEGGAAMGAAVDKLPLEKLRKGMDSYVANYPKEATEYALKQIRAHPDPKEIATSIYIASVSYALAKTDRPALDRYLAELPDNVRPFAAYSATARYVDDGDLESAVASLTPDSEQFTVMRVAGLYAEKDPQGAADWVQQLQGTNSYELSLMEMIRVFARTDAALARRWITAMPAGSNRETLQAELDSAPAARH